jgi:YfiH family protein
MKAYNTNGLIHYKFNILEPFHEIRHFVTGRTGGFSNGPYHSLNLGFGTDDDPEIVLKNRKALSGSLGIPLDWFVFPRQTHSANVAVVDYTHLGTGAYMRGDAIASTDALITNCKNICIVVQVADCVPILLLDTGNSVIATVHAGWRGTLQNILSLTIEKMVVAFNTKPHDIVAAIGPSIGPCCYEVGEELRKIFVESNSKNSKYFINFNKHFRFDLWAANKNQLVQSGVKESNIELAEICTKCNNDKFFSSRAGNGNTGRFIAGIMLQ